MSRCKYCGVRIAQIGMAPGAPLSEPMHWVEEVRDGLTYRTWFTYCEDADTKAEPYECEDEDCCWTGACETCTSCCRGYCTHEAELFADLSKGES